MKKHFLLIAAALLVVCSGIKAQTITLKQDFEGYYNGFHSSIDSLAITPGNTIDTLWYTFDLDMIPDASLNSRPNAWYYSSPFASVDNVPTGYIGSFSIPDSNTVFCASSWNDNGETPAGLEDNWLVSPSVVVGVNDTLFWKSAPRQTPKYLDGYEVLISTTTNDPTSFTTVLFTAAEYTSALGTNDSSFSGYTFAPAGGFIHGFDGTYTADNFLADSSKLIGVLRPFSYSLSAYAGQTIFIAFHHNSHDDIEISVDDIMIRGNNSIPLAAANFTIVADSANPYLFWTYNSSIGTNLTYSWNFGDGNTSTLQAPMHTYAAAGNYVVCLTVTSGVNTSTICHSITVNSVPNICMAMFIIVHDSASSNPNAFIITDYSFGSNLTYLWDFGDTTTSTQQHPVHNYLGAGPYQLCLLINNGAGCTQMHCDSLFAVDSLHSHLQPISFTVVDGSQPPGTTVGINEANSESQINISPNPFTDQTIITFNKEQKNTSIKVMNVLGECIQQLTTNNKQLILDMSSLAKGIYFVRIEDENRNVVNKKIIKE